MGLRLLPGSDPGEQTKGTSASFDLARADFEVAWAVFLSNRTEADFEAWRDQRDWTEKKYRRFDRGERMPLDWKPPPRRASGGAGRHRSTIRSCWTTVGQLVTQRDAGNYVAELPEAVQRLAY
jgi:hypothetical protein